MFELGEEVLVPCRVSLDGKVMDNGNIRVEVVVRDGDFDFMYVNPAIIIRKPKPPKVEDIQPGDEVTAIMRVKNIMLDGVVVTKSADASGRGVFIPTHAILSHTPKPVALPVTDDEFFSLNKEMQRRVLAQYREMAKGVQP